ncbi:MAG: hypothetical protein ACYDC3_18145, partial [Candidatus Binataceae bacterium]
MHNYLTAVDYLSLSEERSPRAQRAAGEVRLWPLCHKGFKHLAMRVRTAARHLSLALSLDKERELIAPGSYAKVS